MKGISFIVPVYNGETTIVECLKSILSQELACNMEIIVVDNGSTDNTMKLLESFPGIILIKEPIKGRSKARNSGAQVARYSLLSFIDCDVVLTPHWANQLIQVLRSPYGAIQTPIIVRGRKRASEFYYLSPVSEFQTIDSAAMMISKEVFSEIKGFSEEFSCWEDTELSMRLMNFGYGLMVVAPCQAMKYQDRNLWQLCIRAFKVGRISSSAVKSWSGKYPVTCNNFVSFVIRNVSVVSFFQILGSAFSSSDIKSKLLRKKGWMRIEEDLIISRELITLIAPNFISLRNFSTHINFAIQNDHPQFTVLLKKAYMGNSIIEDILKIAHSSELNALILRRIQHE